MADVVVEMGASEEDFKGAVCFLTSYLSAYETVHNLMVNGGWGVW